MTFAAACSYFGLAVLITLVCLSVFLRSCAKPLFSKIDGEGEGR